MKEKERGITLIALVITVIILLILAGAAISIGLNQSNIFDKANEAKKNWNGKVQEENTLGRYEETINNYLGENPSGDLEKLKNYYISNNFTDEEVHELNTIDEKVAKYVFYGDEDEKDYVTYNGKLYNVEYDNSEWKVVDVKFVMELNSFSEQQISGIDVLITPSSPENLIHTSYDGLTTFSNTYYLKNNGDLDLTKTFSSGYKTYDDNGDVDGYYDNNGLLALVVEINGPTSFSNMYYLDESGNPTNEPFTHGYQSYNNFYDDTGVLVHVESAGI